VVLCALARLRRALGEGFPVAEQHCVIAVSPPGVDE
jgi:hypothetical protein